MADFVLLEAAEDGEILEESVFSHPNLIITSRRFHILIKTVGRKVLVKYCANLFSEDQLDAIVERAAVTWLELKERRV